MSDEEKKAAEDAATAAYEKENRPKVVFMKISDMGEIKDTEKPYQIEKDGKNKGSLPKLDRHDVLKGLRYTDDADGKRPIVGYIDGEWFLTAKHKADDIIAKIEADEKEKKRQEDYNAKTPDD